MNATALPPPVALVQMMTGYWISKSIYSAAKLGVADVLRDGPQTSEDIALACKVHPDALYRLLRALASVGVFTELDSHQFALTPYADLLRSDHPDSMRALAIMYGEEQYQAWGDVLSSIQTGAPAFDHLFGASYFQYLADHSGASATFNAAMSGWSVQVASAVVDALGFSGDRTVVDVGGGHGTLLSAILAVNPDLRGILFDLPHVAESAAPLLATAGLTERCAAVGGNFFEAVPAGGDTYILEQILHDWDDESSRIILKNCREAMSPDGRLLIIEHVIPAGNEPSLSKLLDLHMLVLLTGRERTESEYRDLLTSAGLRLTRRVPTPSGVNVIEAVRA